MLLPIVLAALISVPSPAGPGAAGAHLASAPGGALLMSWFEPAAGKKHAVKFATYRNGKWSAPKTIVERDDLFVNWADFPSIVADENGVLFVHWLQKSGKGTYAYDVWITASSDGGKTWKTPRVLHRKGKESEYGFVSLVPAAGGGVSAVWLDGRDMAVGHDHGGAMAIRYTEVDAALRTKGETVLDARVCECCTTAMTMTASGPLVAYRDRSEEEIRDIAFTRRVKGNWSKPARVHPDDWKIAGCPVNGPQLDARGNNAVMAWFAAPANQARVSAAFSRDGGATFGKPVRIDSGNAAGRVDVVMLADGSALVTWIEKDAIFVRRAFADGRLGKPEKIASTTSARASGFPRAALIGTEAY
ncbi:MAG TPA: sialidase family protein, partial [Thermoanaerobaculia bacterium]|nr:sialidase family protein [Thermoanaerobaculia bacterium]